MEINEQTDEVLKIIICDDSDIIAKMVQEKVEIALGELGVISEIKYYSSAIEVEKRLSNGEEADILILDISMPEMSGIELAERLRAKNNDILIMFLSFYDSFVFKAIESQPFRFIRKSHIDEEIPSALREAINAL